MQLARLGLLLVAVLLAACGGSETAPTADGATPPAGVEQEGEQPDPVPDPAPAPSDGEAALADALADDPTGPADAADPPSEDNQAAPQLDEPTVSDGEATPDPPPEAVRAAPPPPPPGQPPAEELALPPGFVAYRWADEFFQPTLVDFSPDGRLFIAERFGQVWTVADLDGDGFAERRVLFAEGFREPLTGLLVLDDQTVLVSDESRLIRLIDADHDGVGETAEVVLDQLPFGRHHSNGMAIGPDGRLYLTIGSTCNECAEADPLSATIQALDLTGDDLALSDLETIASGLRNPYDIVFTPDGQLWATDNGSDPPCATPDELNRITPGSHYGWPYCEIDERFSSSVEPALSFGLHPSADGRIWLDQEPYPDEWRRGFYVALFGTGAFGAPQTGKKLQFAQLQPDGGFTLRDFATGFANPLDLTLGADGALYVADFGAGVIYRIFAPSP